MSDNVITLSFNPSKLSRSGKKAFKVLLNECMTAANTPGPISGSTLDSWDVCCSFIKYLQRTAARSSSSQLDTVRYLLDNTVGTYKQVKKAAGHPNGGPAMAGVLSSITRNWQKASKNKASNGVILWDDHKERYYIEPAVLVELRKARDFMEGKIKSQRPVVAA